jgi:hypothetical protein
MGVYKLVKEDSLAIHLGIRPEQKRGGFVSHAWRDEACDQAR